MNNKVLDHHNMDIQDAVVKMMAEKSPQGHQKYTSGYIFDHMAEKYGLKPRTIKNIFWDNGSYRESSAPAQNIATPA